MEKESERKRERKTPVNTPKEKTNQLYPPLKKIRKIQKGGPPNAQVEGKEKVVQPVEECMQ